MATSIMPRRRQNPETYDPTGPLAERVKHDRRAEMVSYFEALPSQRFYAACWVYLSRELRMRPRWRDHRGIDDVLWVAKCRGLVAAYEEAYDRVEVEVWSGTPMPAEARAKPPWEQEPNSTVTYPRHVWDRADKVGATDEGTGRSTKSKGE